MSLNQDRMDRLPATHASIHTPVHDSLGRGVTDLRRRRREEGAEHVVKAAQFLPPADRVLIESIFRDGRRVSDMARLLRGPGRDAQSFAGPQRRASAITSANSADRRAQPITAPVPPTAPFKPNAPDHDARTLRARVRRVVRRMLTPEYQAVARWLALEKLGPRPDHSPLGAEGSLRRKVAVFCFLHGLSLREASRELAASLHTVRRQRDAIAALARVHAHPASEARL